MTPEELKALRQQCDDSTPSTGLNRHVQVHLPVEVVLRLLDEVEGLQEQLKNEVATEIVVADLYRAERDEALDALATMTAARDSAVSQVDYWREEARRYCENVDFWRGKVEAIRESIAAAYQSGKDDMRAERNEAVSQVERMRAAITAYVNAVENKHECDNGRGDEGEQYRALMAFAIDAALEAKP